MKLYLLLIGLCLCCLSLSVQAQVPPVPTTAPDTLISRDSYIRSDRLGITFISSVDSQNTTERYKNALLLGAGWNRWPLYWNRIEIVPDQWDWSGYDRLVSNDIRNGISINAILLGRPEFRADGTSIAGLKEPIFENGSDLPRDGVRINPNNPWARYVFEVVSRYKPGGILAQQQSWRPNQGVRVWEVWNEPDFPSFWQGGKDAYARMLKTAYIVTKTLDPDSTVMFGGLLYATEDNWLSQVLGIFSYDGLSEQYNWFMDAVAIHSYDDPWRSAWLTLYAKQSLRAYGINRPIWVNETGVSVWNDYPGPTWVTSREQRIRLATTDQQAYFFITSAAYAWSEGADKVFFHQLYDDCGNYPAGTNFPPHNGELCANNSTCFGDAWGIYRNPADSVCFSQHPFANTARPVANAYRLVSEVFGREAFGNGDVQTIDGKVIVISFERPRTQERVLVIWNRTLDPVVFPLDKTSDSAVLYTLQGVQSILPDADGIYRLSLAPAADYNFPDLDNQRMTAIGGEPIILVEHVQGGFSPTPSADIVVDTLPSDAIIRGTIQPTPGSILAPPVPPTVDPASDVTEPQTMMEALAQTSPAIFTVRWNAIDDSGISKYFVWVRIDGGEWLPWMETTALESDYAGESGRTYEFAVWAQDLAGNWSPNTDLQAQAMTRVE